MVAAGPVGPVPHDRAPVLVSVIIPARNAEATLADQLEALRAQDHDGPWELVLADNGSTDATVAVFVDAVRADGPGGPVPWIDARVVDADGRPGPAHARNVGAGAAAGDLYCFCDADDVVDRSWLGALVRAAADHHFVGGRLELDLLNSARARGWRPAPSSAVSDAPNFAPTSNLAMWADCFHALGGLDEDRLVSEDVDLSLRARAAGASFAFAPEAVVHYRFRSTLRGVALQGYRSGWATASRGTAPMGTAPTGTAPGGGPRPSGTRSLGRRLGWTVVRLPYLAVPSRRGLWVRRTAEVVGAGAALTRAAVDRRRRTTG